ncbi:MAG: hypothetical protein JKY14_06415 [Paraglaciecola sp.]|nr:hypothetical protein [Paraglaciecola sp.]
MGAQQLMRIDSSKEAIGKIDLMTAPSDIRAISAGSEPLIFIISLLLALFGNSV